MSCQSWCNCVREVHLYIFQGWPGAASVLLLRAALPGLLDRVGFSLAWTKKMIRFTGCCDSLVLICSTDGLCYHLQDLVMALTIQVSQIALTLSACLGVKTEFNSFIVSLFGPHHKLWHIYTLFQILFTDRHCNHEEAIKHFKFFKFRSFWSLWIVLLLNY